MVGGVSEREQSTSYVQLTPRFTQLLQLIGGDTEAVLTLPEDAL